MTDDHNDQLNMHHLKHNENWYETQKESFQSSAQENQENYQNLTLK